MSFLIKITSIVIVVPLVYLAVAAVRRPRRFAKRRDSCSRRQRLQLLFFAAIALLPSAIWYWHAYQIAREILSPSLLRRRRDPNREFLVVLGRLRDRPRYPASRRFCQLIALIGLFVAPRIEDTRAFFIGGWLRWFFSSSPSATAIAIRWYQLPLVPIAAAFAGAACAFVDSKISSRVIAATLSILLVSSFAILAFWYVRPFYQSSAAQLRDAGLELKKVTPPDALIVAADMGDPTIFYYGKRKGWHFLENDAIYNGNPDDSEQAIENLERLRRRGATHFVFTKNTSGGCNLIQNLLRT